MASESSTASTVSPEFDLEELSASFFTELKRRLDDEPHKLPGSIIPTLTKFFFDQEEKRLEQRARELALEEKAQSNPLEVILVGGLPLRRRQEILMDHITKLRHQLYEAENVLSRLEV